MSDGNRDAAVLENHWWCRPGWGHGTRYLTWHLTFQHEPEMHEHVRELQRVLEPFTTLDLVPIKWLHLTLVGVGHTDEVDPGQLRRIIDSVCKAVSSDSFTLSFDRVVVWNDAVAVVAHPSAALDRLRAGLATVVGEVLRDAAPPSNPNSAFHPHVTVAYANSPQDAAPVRTALDEIAQTAYEIPSPTLSLIELHRDNRVYEWRTIADLHV